MMNIFKKILLLTCFALLATQFSWSQSIVGGAYTCTGSGTQTLSVSPTTGITAYSWRNAAGTFTASTASINQPSGSYSVVITKATGTTSLSTTIPSNIVPTAPTISPSTVPTTICGSNTQTLTSSLVANYSWNRNGTALSPAVTTNTLSVAGNSVSTAGTYNFTVTTTNTTTNCTATSSPVAISLLPKPATPVISPSTVTAPICGTATQVLTTAAISGATYFWKRGGTTISSGSNNSITVTGTDVTVAGSYDYTVAVQTSAGCVSDDSSPVTLKVSPKPAAPTVTANDGTTVLCGASTQTLNASGGGSSYTWRRASFILSNTSSSLTVTGNDAAGTFLFTASLTNSVGCVSDYSATGVTLTLSPATTAPIITTPAITTPICGTATQVLTTASGATNYIWKRSGVLITGSTNSITVTGTDVTIPNTYNYTVATVNSSGCTSAESLPYALKVSPKPTTPTISPASFSPNIICGTDFKTLTATSGGAKYNWQRNNVLVTSSTTSNILDVKGVDVPTGGTYSYTVAYDNSVGCSSDYSTTPVVLQLFPVVPAKPTITAAGATIFCEGNSVRLTSSYNANKNVWNSSTGDTTTTGTDGIIVRITNTYTVKALDANGCSSVASNPLTITVNLRPSIPIIDKGATYRICELDSTVLSSNNKGNGSYLWNNNKTTQSITVYGAGSFSLTYTDTQTPACTSLPSLITVVAVDPLPAKPIITALRPTEFCFKDFTTLRASSTTAGTTFEWDFNNAKDAQIDVPLTTRSTKTEFIKVSVKSVSVFPNNFKACKSKDASDVTTITINPLPTTPNITANGPLIFCPDSTVTLTSTDSPNGVYKWINTKDNLEFSNKKAVLIDTTNKYFTTTSLGKVGKFYVRTISDKSCLSDTSQNVTVTVREAPQAASILPFPITATVCEGGRVTMKALVANGNVSKYTWRDESTQKEVSTEPEVFTSTSGSFSVKVRDVFGCFAPYSKPLKVTVNSLPTKPSVLVVKSKIFCEEDSTIVQSTTPSTTPNGTKNVYRWIVDGQTIVESMARQFAWTKASSIAVAVTDTNGCKAVAISDTIRTTVNPLPESPIITRDGKIPFCADKNVTLSAAGGNNLTFKWSTGATTTKIIVNTEGNVTVQSINSFGCLSKPSQAVQVRVYQLPTTPILTANGATTFCDGSRVRLVSSSYLKATWWRDTTFLGNGEDNISIFASKTGRYYARVEKVEDSETTCISQPSAPISVDARANPTPTVIKQVGTFSLDAQGVGDEEGYIWRYNGDLQADLKTRIIKAKKDGDYQVQASISYINVPASIGKLVCYSNNSAVLKYVRDLSFDGMSVFPNPSTDGVINVEVIDDLIGATITIYDLYGRLISEYKVDKFTTIKKIQLPDYHGDTYVVRISTDGFEKTRKVITLKQ
ncbi:T9SS type A sorting domain-containing protein [Arcicella sp. LKC2W]|uniref:Ig-like domain-containing protein n=1 Tax=Arcicella sp. LKC2W TaxID=2984198 RepID=UPI002B2187C9|nr:T9SS type A sorting domain-containing protein [Arcicella sp. LKC2W]MEA5462019.1 T9SS type A sorting domain-containing protein [Arcicella sp. LKC2W]